LPRFPLIDPSLNALSGPVFARLQARIAAFSGERFALHVGDTWMEPVEGAQMQDLRTASHPGLHRYGSPAGMPALLGALGAHHQVDPQRILMTAGATGALNTLARATLAPGDEVLVLAPYWPLIPNIIRTNRGVPVEVPLFGAGLLERLRAAVTPRTAALYVNSPHNPTGAVFSEALLAGLVALCRQAGLWIWSDEVYAPYAWGRPHRSLLDLAPERTLLASSFSKSHGMAGNRCGYLIGPEDAAVMGNLRKVATHTAYAAPTASQLAGLRALELGGPWIEAARAAYRAAGEAAADRLQIARPEGGTFLFFDVASALDERGLDGFLEDCVDQGILVAPGTACGGMFQTWIRLCYTSLRPEDTARAVGRLAQLIADKGGRAQLPAAIDPASDAAGAP